MKKLITVLLTTSLISACGWHLRGNINLPQDLNSLHVVSQDQYSELTRDLKEVISKNNITLSDSTSADYSIELLEERNQRRAASVGGNGLASEYELTLEVDYTISRGDQLLLPKTTARATRSYDYDQNQVLGSNQEQQVIERELRFELLQNILRRLRFTSKAANATPEADAS